MKQLFKLLCSASLDYKISENDIMSMINLLLRTMILIKNDHWPVKTMQIKKNERKMN